MDRGKPSDGRPVSDIVRQLRAIAVQRLPGMYYPDQRLFAFRLRKDDRNEIREGASRRYTAIVLIGLASEDRGVAAQVLCGHNAEDVCTRLIEDLDAMDDLGEVALTTWAARALGHSKTAVAIRALRQREPWQRPYRTVELSWALTALVAEGSDTTDMAQAQMTARALLATFKRESGIFGHWSPGSIVPRLRAHVSCFADFVYPVQALSYYYLATGDAQAAEAAVTCAEHICQLQGPGGQWWWHYDIRTGRVVEKYPVYAVHQDAMAPMALLALAKACGRDSAGSIENGLHWLVSPSESAGSLIDAERNVIWRKVARREPRRLVRGLQASCVHPGLRAPAVDFLFPPVAIDYETRPYEMGWILHAWPATRELPLRAGPQVLHPSAELEAHP
jgi:hypothetical protein